VSNLALGTAAIALLVSCPAAAQAKDFVFTGELVDARTGAPHPDPAALRIVLLSRAATPKQRGCDPVDRYAFERKDPVRVERAGAAPGHFTFRIPPSSGPCSYRPLNVRFQLGKDRRVGDPIVAYVVNDDGTLYVKQRDWALLSPDNHEDRELWFSDTRPVRRGKHVTLAYLEPRYTEITLAVAETRDSRATRFYTQDEAIRSVYWELFFQRRGLMNQLPYRLPAVETILQGDAFLAWSSPVQWLRHAQGQRSYYAGVTDPWAWLVEGEIRRDGDAWKVVLASVAPAPGADGAAPRLAPTRPLFSNTAAALVEGASQHALLEQARNAVVEAGVSEITEYDVTPRQVEHKGLGRVPEMAGDVVISGSTAMLRLRAAYEDKTLAHNFRLQAAVDGPRVAFARPEMVAFEHWTMSDRTWGERICGDRNPQGEPFVFDWMTKRIAERRGRAESLTRCNPTDAAGCRLGVEGGRTWFGRCWWDPAAQDVLLGQRPLPVRRTRYWVAPAAATSTR
jgi:hypothetical protein